MTFCRVTCTYFLFQEVTCTYLLFQTNQLGGKFDTAVADKVCEAWCCLVLWFLDLRGHWQSICWCSALTDAHGSQRVGCTSEVYVKLVKLRTFCH